MLPMRDGQTTNDEQGKIELLSQWMLDGWVSQLWLTYLLARSLAGVRCRATSVAKNQALWAQREVLILFSRPQHCSHKFSLTLDCWMIWMGKGTLVVPSPVPVFIIDKYWSAIFCLLGGAAPPEGFLVAGIPSLCLPVEPSWLIQLSEITAVHATHTLRISCSQSEIRPRAREGVLFCINIYSKIVI